LAASNKNKALTLDERKGIETGIRNGSTKTALADTIGKDKSTVGKEIRRHRILKHKCPMPLECSNYAKCKFHRHCLVSCPSYLKFSCTRRDRSPGACNGCGSYSQCRFNKYYYDANTAHDEYRKELVDSREGVNLAVSQAKEIAAVIGPLLKKGHSPYQIIQDNPDLGISEKTLYNYISQQVFSVAGIYDIDLRRKVSRKPSKKLAKTYKKRENRAFLKGMEYKDFLAYKDEHPDAHILLTDRGTEFSDADGLEIRDDSTRRCRVFYCDPMQSGQKGSLENYHELLRYICPKETDLRTIGLTGQNKLNLALSHINSSSVESLAGKSPIEYTKFMYPELWERLHSFGICEIPRNDIILKPYLLK